MDLLYQDFEMPEYLPETIDNSTILPTETLINHPIEDHRQKTDDKFQLETSMDEGNIEDLFSSTNEDNIIEDILSTLSEINPDRPQNAVYCDSSPLDEVHSDENLKTIRLANMPNSETLGSPSDKLKKCLEPSLPAEENKNQEQSIPQNSVESEKSTNRKINASETIDVANLSEKELSCMQTSKIIDKWCQKNDQAFAINSLPEILMIKATWKSDILGRPYIDVVGAFAKENIPVGSRFGPLVGQRYELDNEPVDKSNCWKVFEENSEFIVDLSDDSKANWMKYVKPAYKSSAQNLVAYQEGKDVFFLTIKPIKVDEEITFWFCKDYSERLKCPITGDLMMEHMKQQQQQLEWQHHLMQQQRQQQQQQVWQQQQWQHLQDQTARGSRSSASPDSGYTGSPPPQFCDSSQIQRSGHQYPEAEVLYGDSIENPSRKTKVTLVLHHKRSQYVPSQGPKYGRKVGLPRTGNKDESNKVHGNLEHTSKTGNVSNNGNGGLKTPSNLLKKNDMYDREYTCKDCGKVFKQLSNLDTHMRIHSGQRPFKCEICEKGFTQKAHKEKHMLIHTGEKPYECVWPGCGKKFSSSSNLKTHEKIHEGKKDFVCEICTLAFSQAVHLKQHIGIHNNERPFVCQPCGKEYISDSALKTHKKKKNCGLVKQLDQDEQQKLQERLMQQWLTQQQWKQQLQQQWEQIPWQQQQIKREIY